ncbi:flavoprotein [Clostridium saccharobutylicum]|uniref:Coenzyme A biosynthesis bifunctional protein CoaBC n=1 Tax=Clostridium saccharobutylicum TaxID=169679 RepID=A0A1S8NDG8_CLOSA|nr:flavoprotein [Clostridium saccharobutylicum]OOM14443.1 coenzyme A biosynthesis bifunctional protein CoaBC [Clostridium saccharobutylicum]
MLSGKIIILGITACSPANQSLALIRELKKRGAQVHVIMTSNAVNFVTPLMVQREAGTPIQIDQFELPKAYDMNHQSLSFKSDLMLVAPVSANTLGKAANGIADNLLTTNLLSTKSPVIFATHINPTMYSKPSVQRNVKTLKEEGIIFVENIEAKYPSLFPSIEAIIKIVEEVII